jgi:hypothetical protein
MSDSPVIIIYGSDGVGGYEEKGKFHPFTVDGYGVAGTPAGGVLSVQGVISGQPIPISASALPLPSGAATSALQTTGNNNLSSIDGKLGSLGQKTMTGSAPVVIASNQSAIPVTGSFGSSIIPNATDATGTIVALNGTVSAARQGYSSCGLVLTGTWTGAVVFELSADGGTTWVGGAFVVPPQVPAPIPGLVVALTTNGTYECIGMGASTHVRIRAATAVTGTINVRIVCAASPPALLAAFTSMQQNVTASTFNNSTANLAAGAAFTGTGESTLGVAGIQVNIKADQPVRMLCQQSTDGTNWDISDDQIFLAGEGDSRTFQATASYFRIVATNIGNATTTYFRLQVALCPVVEALPRALTPLGRLRLASMTNGFTPDPYAMIQRDQHQSLLMDLDRSLQVRGRVLTDESSFREDFAAGDLYQDLTGTVYFTNGSTIVTGVGTAFTTELNMRRFLKRSTHADSAYAPIKQIWSDTFLDLDEPYTGATASGTGRSSRWQYTATSGASISQASSEVSLVSGTTSGAKAEINRAGDYLPYVLGFKARITQRIANQVAHVGLGDDHYATAANQAFVTFSGTNNTQATLRTSSSAADVEQTTFTLPNGLVSSTSAYYQLEVTANKVTLYVNDVWVAEHRLHIPNNYAEMYCHGGIENTGTAGSTTTLALDTFWLQNFNRIQIGTFVRGDPISTNEQRASKSIVTSVAAAVSDTVLLAANPSRLGATMVNDGTSILYLKLGTGASLTSYTVRMTAYAYFEVPFGYVGPINGYWAAASGSARITEVQ